MNIKRYILGIVCCMLGIMGCAEVGTSAERLSLDSCLRLARENNAELRKARLNVRRAEEVKAQAFTKYFPQIQGTAFGYHALHPAVEIGIEDMNNAAVRDLLTTLYGNYGAALGLDNTFNLFRHGYMAGVTAVQPVFMGGKIVAGNKLAKVGVEAAKLQEEISERDILEETEQAYWLVYGLQEKQHIIDDATTLLDTIYQTVLTAVEAGLALPADLMRVEIERDDIARRQVQLQSAGRLAGRALGLALGRDNEHWNLIDTDEQILDSLMLPPLETETAGSAMLTPEARLLELGIQASKLQRRIELADALPQLAVGANYSYSRWQTNFLRRDLGSKTGNGALFVTLKLPITAWWETAHKLREHQYAVEQAEIEADYIGGQLMMRTQQAYDRMVDAAAMVRIQSRTLTHAREAYETMAVNFSAGMATVADLLQARTTLTQAQTDLTDARITLRIAARRYRDLTGNR